MPAAKRTRDLPRFPLPGVGPADWPHTVHLAAGERRVSLELPVSKYAHNYALLQPGRIPFSIALATGPSVVDSETLGLVLVLGFQRLLSAHGRSPRRNTIALVPSIVGDGHRSLAVPGRARWVIAVVQAKGQYVSIVHHRASGTVFCMNPRPGGENDGFVARYLKATQQMGVYLVDVWVAPAMDCGYACILNALFAVAGLLRHRWLRVGTLAACLPHMPGLPSRADSQGLRLCAWRSLREWGTRTLKKTKPRALARKPAKHAVGDELELYTAVVGV